MLFINLKQHGDVPTVYKLGVRPKGFTDAIQSVTFDAEGVTFGTVLEAGGVYYVLATFPVLVNGEGRYDIFTRVVTVGGESVPETSIKVYLERI